MMPFGEFLVVSSLDYICVDNSGGAVYIVAS